MTMSRQKTSPAEVGGPGGVFRFYDFTTFSLGSVILPSQKKEHRCDGHVGLLDFFHVSPFVGVSNDTSQRV